ncbi:helix-turn-helix domain-containing protein [Paraburkholderia sp. BR10872]|uniref:helix-turn-helix domain-containing protein n=1 Tax=Paraburkholderia sp. BR10872 TaxID=3236989 RepID=UPI0034D23F5F
MHTLLGAARPDDCYTWPEKEHIDASTVNLVVSRQRRKLAREGIEVRIDTISRDGYQLTSPTFD